MSARILICEAARGSLGSPRPRSPVDFSSRRTNAHHSAVPSKRFTSRIQLSSRALLFRVPSPPCPTRRLPKETAVPHLPRFLALLATSRACVHFPARLPKPAYVSSSGFRNLSTIFSALALAGLFHPAATSRALLFRVFSSPAAIPPHRKERAPWPLFPAHSPPKRCPCAEPSTSRPSSA